MKKIQDIRIGIVESSFRKDVTRELEKRCVRTLLKRGLSRRQIRVVRVPGALEIPLIAKKMAASGKYDALIALGAVLKGKTYHFEQIANECVRGCMEVSLAYNIPVIFEVLSVYDLKDALARATRKKENKGIEAAESALTMIRLIGKRQNIPLASLAGMNGAPNKSARRRAPYPKKQPGVARQIPHNTAREDGRAT